jgi:divalent metal cation (Fe/Co/Zn/Cd) transporter
VGLGVIRQPWLAVQALILILALSSMVLGIATVFMIKSDLERHYNDREHAGLVLGGVMTFFFSFLYFQYHLYDIAKRRKRVAEALGARAYDVQSS